MQQIITKKHNYSQAVTRVLKVDQVSLMVDSDTSVDDFTKLFRFDSSYKFVTLDLFIQLLGLTLKRCLFVFQAQGCMFQDSKTPSNLVSDPGFQSSLSSPRILCLLTDNEEELKKQVASTNLWKTSLPRCCGRKPVSVSAASVSFPDASSSVHEWWEEASEREPTAQEAQKKSGKVNASVSCHHFLLLLGGLMSRQCYIFCNNVQTLFFCVLPEASKQRRNGFAWRKRGGWIGICRWLKKDGGCRRYGSWKDWGRRRRRGLQSCRGGSLRKRKLMQGSLKMFFGYLLPFCFPLLPCLRDF